MRLYDIWDKFQEWRWQRTKARWAEEWEQLLSWRDDQAGLEAWFDWDKESDWWEEEPPRWEGSE